MKKMLSKMTHIILVALPLVVFFSCAQKEKKHKKKDGDEVVVLSNQAATPNESNSQVNCDTSLWKYVYNRDRLQVTEECKTVTGVIEESNADDDGDQHMLLKLDGDQDQLLTKKNIKKKQGDMVIEAVCINNVKLKKVGTTCTGYVNHITLPAVGDHVKVTGSLVIDTHNGWAEIHPITKIEMLH